MDVTYQSKQNGALHWLWITAFVIWLIFTISSFFVVNKPVDANLAQGVNAASAVTSLVPAAVLRALLDLAVAAWISLVALGIGNRTLTGFMDERLAGVENLVFGTGIGFGILGVIILVLGLLGLYSSLAFVLLLSMLTLIVAPSAFSCLKSLSLQRTPSFSTLYVTLTMALAFTLALLPPTSWDALSYHLTGPKLYLQAGRISPGIDIPPLNYPSLLEMLFSLSLGLRSDVVAKLIHFVYVILLGGGLYITASRLLNVRNAWLAVAFLASTPLVTVVGAWAYNDVALSFYGLAALYAFLRWQSSQNQRWLVLSGISSGFMMGLKYTAIVPTIFLAALLLWRFRQKLRASIKPLLLFTLPAAMLVSPWLLKNWTFTGNPFYPFVFHGRFWDAFRSAEFGSLGTGIGLDILALLRLPYVVTLGYADATQEATIGPFYLIFLPWLLLYGLGPLRRHVPPVLKTILAYSLISYLFWTLGVINSAHLWQARFLLPGIVPLCALFAWVTEDLKRFDYSSFSLQRFMRLVLMFVFSLLLLSQIFDWLQINPLAYLSGIETREEYLQGRLGVHYEVMVDISSQLGDEAAVIFLWEPRSYYCDRDCRPDVILDRLEHMHFLYGDAEAIVDQWLEDGVSHVLIYETGLNFIIEHGEDPLSARELVTMQNIRERFLVPVREWDDSYILYRLEK